MLRRKAFFVVEYTVNIANVPDLYQINEPLSECKDHGFQRDGAASIFVSKNDIPAAEAIKHSKREQLHI